MTLLHHFLQGIDWDKTINISANIITMVGFGFGIYEFWKIGQEQRKTYEGTLKLIESQNELTTVQKSMLILNYRPYFKARDSHRNLTTNDKAQICFRFDNVGKSAINISIVGVDPKVWINVESGFTIVHENNFVDINFNNSESIKDNPAHNLRISHQIFSFVIEYEDLLGNLYKQEVYGNVNYIEISFPEMIKEKLLSDIQI